MEREEQRAVLDGALAAGARGSGQLVVICGPMASGKTALLHDFLGRAAGRGVALATATAAHGERGLDMGVIRQIAGNLVLAEPCHDTSTLVEAAAWSEAPRSDGHLVEDLCTFLTQLAARQPVVVAVDDVHAADASSLRGLLYLQRRLRFANVVMVLTEQNGLLPPEYEAFRAQITRWPNTSHARLALLSPNAVAELLERRFDRRAADLLATGYHELSGGNPLLLHGLLEDFAATRGEREDTALTRPEPIGLEFQRAVRTLLHRWGRPQLAVAQGTAVLGEAATPALLGSLLGLTEDTANQAIGDLESTGLLHAGRFRHPLARTAALGSLSGAERARLHLGAADLLYTHDTATSQVADQLVAADRHGIVPDRPWASDVLRHTAQEAMAHEDVDLAKQRLSLAVRSVGDLRGRVEVTSLLLQAEWPDKPNGVTRYVELLRQARADGWLSREDALPLAKVLLWYGHLDDLKETMRVLSESGPQDLTRNDTFGLAMHWLAFLCPPAAEGVAGLEPAGPGRPADTPWSKALTMLGLLRSGGPREEVATAAEELLSGYSLTEQTFDLQASALTAMLFTDHHDRAGYWSEALLSKTAGTGARVWEAVLTAVHAHVLLRQGELTRADELARRATDMLTPRGWGTAIGLPLSARLAALTKLGRHQAAVTQLRMPVPDSMYQTLFGMLFIYERGLHYLETGQVYSALHEFEACGDRLHQWGMDLPTAVPWRVGATEANVLLGRTAAARRLAEEQLGNLGPGGTRMRGMALRAVGISDADPAAAVRTLRESVAMLDQAGDVFESSRALRSLSRALESAGESEAARAAHRRLEQLVRGLSGATDEAADVDGGSSAPSSPTEEEPGARGLTRAERRVAALAALGYTNKEIEAKLFITVSTVEQHLTRVYRKLNVRRRADLPVGLRRFAPQTVGPAAEV
ncbi:LuxR family transcriptional regulator [Nocardiopsis sp. Huas11]|uniref:helix-turn-helix transcriptional regulator n=1 Tax=Nocardiopsis sp. Huas11 TaxID=2183912 RepID=UPI0013154C75|nr:AAA family ATPase [Nocardiopsis sp. Huas11]